eukprot:CFRG3735T1
MYRLLLEIDDSTPYLEDPLFSRPVINQPTGTEDINTTCNNDQVTVIARGKIRGQRKARNLQISRFDMSNVDEHLGIPFFSGNPIVETTSGILHLYKYANNKENTEQVTLGKLPDQRSLTVCIIAVPNAFGVTDLLSFLAPVESGLVHVRLISDSAKCELNYMVLLQFKEQSLADEFYIVYNNSRFTFLEDAVCHVFFVKNIENSKSRDLDLKLMFGITELPSCAVCLERIDEDVSGILTTLCNHSFHCECMKSWRDHSCPVCRHTQKTDTGSVCEICKATDGLWICLICGHVGCGRYLDKHSYLHFSETQHTYAMELQTQRVWDYVADNYVHRLIQSTSDGKPVEVGTASGANENEKVDSLTLEYTYLLTSQLESQRKYYTEKLAEQSHEAKCKIEMLDQKIRSRQAENDVNDKKINELKAKLAELHRTYDEEMEVGRSMVSAQIEWQKRVAELEKARTEDIAVRDKQIQDLQEQLGDLMLFLDTRDKLNKELGADTAHESEIVAITGMTINDPSTSNHPGPRRKKMAKKGKKK